MTYSIQTTWKEPFRGSLYFRSRSLRKTAGGVSRLKRHLQSSNVKISSMTAISKGDLAYTGPEIITSHRLREIEQLICDLFTHQRQVDTIFFTQFHATHGKL